MRTIEVSRGGTEIGTVQFRGIATNPLARPMTAAAQPPASPKKLRERSPIVSLPVSRPGTKAISSGILRAYPRTVIFLLGGTGKLGQSPTVVG
jgi:hypothetical protein